MKLRATTPYLCESCSWVMDRLDNHTLRCSNTDCPEHSNTYPEPFFSISRNRLTGIDLNDIQALSGLVIFTTGIAFLPWHWAPPLAVMTAGALLFSFAYLMASPRKR